MFSYTQIIEKAKELIPWYQKLIEENNIGYEQKGILFSEVFFALCCINLVSCKRIIESGTARGQSTLLLSQALPQKDIISIEFNKHSPDVKIAVARLEDQKNVFCEFGDSQKILPQIVKSGDVIVIDGPKMFLAIRLALKMLATKKVTGVFIHDVNLHTAERKFLDDFLPEAKFSDARIFAETAGFLDEHIQHYIPKEQQLESFKGEYGYGFSLAFIPFSQKRYYRFLIFFTYIYDGAERIKKLFSKFL